LAKEPADRFADANAVAEAVAAHRAGVEKRLRAAEVRAAKRRWQVAVVGCVGLLMLGGVVAAWWMDRQETRKRAEIDAKENERKLAAAQAEFDRDARKQQAEERVPRLMEQALALRRQCKFREAENLLNQAAALASNGLTPLLVDQVGLAKEDLEVVERLDDIRMKQSIRIIELGGKWTYDTAKAPAMYLAVFRQRGFDFEHDEPARLAAWGDGSRVKVELVAAVGDWAV